MASKTKGRPKKSSTATKIEQKNVKKKAKSGRRQLYSIIWFAIAIFLLFVICIKGENLWFKLHNFLYGVFGFNAICLPIIIGLIAVMYALDKLHGTITAKIIESIIFIVLVAAAVEIFIARPAPDLGAHLKDAFYAGISGGGWLGALIGRPLFNAFGATGAAITVILLALVFLMLITGTTLLAIFRAFMRPVEKIGEHADEVYGEDEEAEAENAEEPARGKKGRNKKNSRFVDIPVDDIPVERERVKPDMNEMQREVVKTYHDIDQEKSEEIAEEVKNTVAEEAKESEPAGEEKQSDSIKNSSGISITDEGYRFPPLSLLNEPRFEDSKTASSDLDATATHLVDTLRSFGVETRIVDISRGPAVTRYELQPSAGVKISKITNLANDIALNLAVAGVRIEAPIPNKAAVGIEVPNKQTCGVTVREVIESPAFANSKSNLTVALGRDIAGNVVVTDIAKMPHGLIAGATGSGKSVCINSIIISLLYKSSPDDVKLLLIDPKVVELGIYNGIPHLLVPVVTDPRKASGALGWAVSEMEKRYKLFADNNVRDLGGYNKLAEQDENLEKMPQIVIIIDELADLMMTAPREVEESICRIAQKARAAGMHLLIATQRPSVDVVTGLIKANVPSRIAFTVSSQVDSRTILDVGGAEKLLGRGDMLFSPVGSTKANRVQGCFVSDDEVASVVEYVKTDHVTEYDEDVMNEIERQAAIEKKQKTGLPEDGPADDPMLPNAIAVVVEAGQASTSLLQRKLKLGYARAARIIDEMADRGIIGPFEGAKPRQVLISKEQLMEMQARNDE
ncbi:MAG: DNA translocase FtsK 4TM domain-containing protein [Clostridia bacterium]|nr:DNA translocase FtsK 4TM domain-containing protein [Clostridia bacterium]